MARTNLTSLYLSTLPVSPNSKNQLATKMAEHDSALDTIEASIAVVSGAELIDPRFGVGIDASIGATMRRHSGGLKQSFRKWGSGVNDWERISRPSILMAESASDVQDCIRAAVGDDALVCSPSNLWIPRRANHSSIHIPADVPDLIGGLPLTTLAGSGAERRKLYGIAGEQVVIQTKLNNGYGWATAAAALDEPTGSFAILLIVRPWAIGGGNWFLSHRSAAISGAANSGVYAFGYSAEGEFFTYVRDVAGNVATSQNNDAGDHTDGWHPVIAGLFRPSGLNTGTVAVQTDVDGQHETAAAIGNIGNTTAKWGLYSATDQGGITADFALLAHFRGVDAENLIATANATKINDIATGILAR